MQHRLQVLKALCVLLNVKHLDETHACIDEHMNTYTGDLAPTQNVIRGVQSSPVRTRSKYQALLPFSVGLIR